MEFKGLLMRKEFLRLPLYTFMSGIILRMTDYLIVRILMGGTAEWTSEMGTIAFYIRLILCVLIFFCIGLLLRQRYSRRNFMKSATFLMLYSVVMLAME